MTFTKYINQILTDEKWFLMFDHQNNPFQTLFYTQVIFMRNIVSN